jgi:hypothetical protein
MTRVVLRVALLALLLTPRAATAQDPGRMHRDSSIFTFCRSPGRHPSALALPSGAPATRNAAPIPLSFMGCGRNMTTAFQNIAKFQRRGLIAASSPPCSI